MSDGRGMRIRITTRDHRPVSRPGCSRLSEKNFGKPDHQVSLIPFEIFARQATGCQHGPSIKGYRPSFTAHYGIDPGDSDASTLIPTACEAGASDPDSTRQESFGNFGHAVSIGQVNR